MIRVDNVKGLQVKDSRERDTVGAQITLVEMPSNKSSTQTALVPSGASTGSREVLELRDSDGGMESALSFINSEIKDHLRNGSHRLSEPFLVDNLLLKLDGTDNLSRLGGNSILAVSLAYARARAELCGIPLYQSIGGSAACRMPVPLMNIINGGSHSTGNLVIQEYMIVPHGSVHIFL